MTYNEAKYAILFQYHKNIDYWYKLVGEMYEVTDGFTKFGEIAKKFNGIKYYIRYNNNEWYIVEE